MYPCTKFRLTWRTSDSEIKFAPKNFTNFEKINMKIVISIQHCTPLRIFSHFVKLQIMVPNLPKNNMTNKKLKK